MCKDPLFRFVIFFLFMVLMAILLLGCRTKKECTTDMVARADSSEAVVATAEQRLFMSMFDSLTVNRVFAADSIVVCWDTQSTDTAATVAISTKRGRNRAGSVSIYGASVRSQASRQTTAHQGTVKTDSFDRFRHWRDSAAVHTKEVRHPPNAGGHRIVWFLLLMAFIFFLLYRAKR